MLDFYRLIFCILLYVSVPTAGYCDVSRSIIISITNKTPEFAAQPAIEVFGAPSKPFLSRGDGIYEYILVVDNQDWYIPVSIKISWKNVRSEDGRRLDLEQRVEFRFRSTFPEKFSFDIFYSDDMSNNEMSRLEELQDINEQYEKFFRGIQITKYYRKINGYTHARTKRAAKIAFEAAKKLAEYPRYIFVMSDDAERYILDAKLDPIEYKTKIANTRSLYWTDLLFIDDMINKNQCIQAISVIEALKDRMGPDVDLYKRQFALSPSFFDVKRKFVESSCGKQKTD